MEKSESFHRSLQLLEIVQNARNLRELTVFVIFGRISWDQIQAEVASFSITTTRFRLEHNRTELKHFHRN